MIFTQTFHITPTSDNSTTVVLIILGLLLLMSLFFLYLLARSRIVRYTVTAEGLQIKAALYGRKISRSILQMDQARLINLDSEPDWAWSAWSKNNGMGLPGCRLGWYRNKKLDKRCLVFLSSRESVLYIPTTEKYGLLLSATEPEQLLNALKA